MVNKDLQNKQQSKAKFGVVSTTTEDNGKKSTITLNEAKKKARNSATKSTNEILVKDIYQNVSNLIGILFSFFAKSSKVFATHQRISI